LELFLSDLAGGGLNVCSGLRLETFQGTPEGSNPEWGTVEGRGGRTFERENVGAWGKGKAREGKRAANKKGMGL